MSNQPRFKTNTTDSFFGDFLYEQLIPKDHFLKVAKDSINWSKFTDRLLVWYQGSGMIGRPAYDPSVMLRMLFLAYLYNLSERQVEEKVNFDLTFKYFVDLGLDEKAPDHSSLTRFKDRLIAGAGKSAFDQLLREILNQAKTKGIEFGSIQIVDSVHTIANVNTDKDKARQNHGDSPRDPDARWGCKGEKEKQDPETGQIVKIKDYFHGFKAHASYNEQARLVTSVSTTAGNRPDGKELPKLLNKDNFTPISKKVRIYTADKAYDDGENHLLLNQKGYGDAIRLTKTRTEKKNPNKEPWLKLRETKEYIKGLRVRPKIESKFGEGKTNHSLRRCRYLGEKKYHLQACLTAIVLNLKVVVASITGSTQKGYGFIPNTVRLTPT